MDEDDWLAAQAERTPSPEPDDDFFAEFEPRGLLEGEHTDEPVPATSSASQPAPTPAPVREQGKLSSCAIQGADSWIPDENDTLGGGDHEDDFFADNAKMDEIFGAALEDTGLLGESTGEPAPQAADSVMPFAPDPGQGESSLPASDTRSDAALAASLAREIDESQRDLGNALAQLGTSSMGGDDHASGSALPESETPAIPAASNYSFQYGRRDDRGIPKYLLVASSVAFTFDGSEVKLPRRRRMKGWRAPKTHYDLDAGDGKIDHRTGAVQLTAQPVYQMMDNVRRRKAEAKRRAEDALAAEPQRAVLQDIQDMDRPVPMSRSAKLPQAQAAEAQLRSKLWVDKHCPSTFAHLLGEERIHRAVLGWIKAWDPCVFKTTPPPVEANPDTPWDKPDPLHRPREKVLLLSGPAGAGKTTLAHVLAKQAGYDVFEMNASDARSASSVDEVLRQALDAGSSVRGGKPTLVVLDEIDGATGGSGDGASFIRSLMRLIERGSLPPRSKKGRKGGKQPLVLQRPIICICNDLYAPSLRTLRPLAKVLRVPVPPFKTVVQRLRQVSSLEGLPTDNKGLTLLTELTGGDLRSCLNALQLLAVQHGQTASEQGSRNQRARRGITEESLRSAALGIKDGGSSLPRVWDVLLRARDSRKLQALSAAALLAPEAPGRAQSDTWLMAVVHELQLSGEYDKINTGLASAWPSFLATAKDDGWERAVKALDWLSFGETLSLSMRGGSFEMLPYCPYAIAPWHGLFAHYRIPLPDYPRQDFEARQRTQAFQEIVQSVQDALPPHFRATFDADRVATELGPMLTKIVNPLIKPINSMISVPSERAAAEHAVEVMLSLGIRFVQDKNEAGHTVYRTEPPLDDFVDGLEEDIALLTGAADASAPPPALDPRIKGASGGSGFAVRHYLAREIGKVVFARDEKAKAEALAASGKARAHGAQLTKNYLSGQTGNDAGNAQDTPAAKDFFGRPVAAKSASANVRALPADNVHGVEGDETSSEPAAKRMRPHPKVTFKFNEGFSNAVRKSIKVQDLL